MMAEKMVLSSATRAETTMKVPTRDRTLADANATPVPPAVAATAVAVAAAAAAVAPCVERTWTVPRPWATTDNPPPLNAGAAQRS
jgi:hypothetical protein